MSHANASAALPAAAKQTADQGEPAGELRQQQQFQNPELRQLLKLSGLDLRDEVVDPLLQLVLLGAPPSAIKDYIKAVVQRQPARSAGPTSSHAVRNPTVAPA